MTTYRYTPLQEDGRSIRLFTLEPGAFDDDIYGRLHHVVLSPDNPPMYEALSYVWGTTEHPKPLFLSGPTGTTGSLSITQNLAATLPYLRLRDRPRALWIDAICIDQSNIQERSQQVTLMGDIYRLARRVIAWLGPDSGSSSFALAQILRLSQNIEVDWDRSMMSPSANSSITTDGLLSQDGFFFAKNEIEAICELVLRDYFERLWIRQEVGLGGERVTVTCGQDEIPWEAFRKAMYYLYLHSLTPKLGSKSSLFSDRMDLIARFIFSGRAFPVQSLRTEMGQAKCADARDKIYGALNLIASSERDIGIIPDYSKSAAEVYRQVTLAWIKAKDSLGILTSCEARGLQELPSWVPDWSVPRLSRDLWVPFDIHELHQLYQLLRHPSDEPGILQTHGIAGTTITRRENLVQAGHDQLIQRLRHVIPRDIRQKSYVTGESLLEAYCRTLVCNESAELFVPPNHMYPSYQALEKALSTIMDFDNGATDFGAMESSIRHFEMSVRLISQGRCLFWTSEGYIGLAPENALLGDMICTLIGYRSPFVLRPVQKSKSMKYLMVGECYVHGLMQHQGLLGPLPSCIRPAVQWDDRVGGYLQCYQDKDDGTVHREDPRVLSLLEKIATNGLIQEATVESLKKGDVVETLRKYGIDLQRFDLV